MSLTPRAERTARFFCMLLGITLRADDSLRRRLLQVRLGLVLVSVGYLALLSPGLLMIQSVGERHWLSGTLLYLLPTYWLLPLVVLMPLSVLFSPRACWWQSATLLFVGWLFLRPHWPASPQPLGPTFSIVNGNTGQRNLETLQTLVRKVQPDFITLQESSPEQGQFLASVSGTRHVRADGEFVLVSRFPIVSSGLIPETARKREAVAAWFEVDCDGKRLIIYNLHLPTPRPDFYNLRGRGFFRGLFCGGGIYSSQVRRAFAESMRYRLVVAQKLAERMAADTRLFVAAGDLNAPSPGYVSRLFSSRMTDAFATVGNGPGMTFPGVTRNPLSLFGPWLRIDYFFTSHKLQPLECWVEPHEPAQHRALVGRFALPHESPRQP